MVRTLHFVWVGDDSKRPDNCIDTWRQHNPSWDIKIWGNDDLNNRPWKNKRHMQAIIDGAKELCGVADLMRYEILLSEGGFALDADAVALKPLEDWLFDTPMFACWENEIVRPNLVANGYMYAIPNHPIVKRMVDDLAATPSIVHARAWKVTGPMRITNTLRTCSPELLSMIRIYPSHFFMPEHLTGQKYEGDGPIFARQFWSSTRNDYDTLHTKTV